MSGQTETEMSSLSKTPSNDQLFNQNYNTQTHTHTHTHTGVHRCNYLYLYSNRGPDVGVVYTGRHVQNRQMLCFRTEYSLAMQLMCLRKVSGHDLNTLAYTFFRTYC